MKYRLSLVFILAFWISPFYSSAVERPLKDGLTSEAFIHSKVLTKIGIAERILCHSEDFLGNKSFANLVMTRTPENFKDFVEQTRVRLLDFIENTSNEIRTVEKGIIAQELIKDSLDTESLGKSLGAHLSSANDSLIFYPDPPAKNSITALKNFLDKFGTGNQRPRVVDRKAPDWQTPKAFHEFETDPEKIKKAAQGYREASKLNKSLVNQRHKLQAKIVRAQELLSQLEGDPTFNKVGYMKLKSLTLYLNPSQKEIFLYEGRNAKTGELSGIELCKKIPPDIRVQNYYTLSREECNKIRDSLPEILEEFAIENMSGMNVLNLDSQRILSALEKDEAKRLENSPLKNKRGQPPTAEAEAASLRDYAKKIELLESYKKKPNINELRKILMGNDNLNLQYVVRESESGVEFYPVISEIETRYLSGFKDNFLGTKNVGAPKLISDSPVLIIDSRMLHRETSKKFFNPDNKVRLGNLEGTLIRGEIAMSLFNSVYFQCEELD